ncbi:MAG: hypothetical protein LBI18_14275 [Planctomycetaceae bacterium]|nr:hypothetical protein [Planctomycetaceae bacterium]
MKHNFAKVQLYVIIGEKMKSNIKRLSVKFFAVFTILSLIIVLFLFFIGFFSVRTRIFYNLEKNGIDTWFAQPNIDIEMPKCFIFTYCKLQQIFISSESNIKETLFKDLSQIRETFHLNISNSKINDEILDIIVQMKNVHELELKECTNISDLGITKLQMMSNLKYLNLFSVDCSDIGCESLRDMPNLQYLVVAHTRVSGKCFGKEGWKILKSIDLNYCKIDKNVFNILSNLPRLQTLRVTYYPGLFEDLLPLLSKESIRKIWVNVYDLDDLTIIQLKENLNPKIELRKMEYFYPVETIYDRMLID